MKKFSYISLLLLIGGVKPMMAQQIQFLDIENNAPIAAVNVYNAQGVFVGASDADGYLRGDTLLKNDAQNGVKLSIRHISYAALDTLMHMGSPSQIVLLHPASILMKEVVVSNAPKDFVLLKGYYRSIDMVNHRYRYFSDGIVAYYIPLKKGKIKSKIIANRVFGNASVIADFKNAMGNFAEPPHIPAIYPLALSQRLPKGHQILSGADGQWIQKNGQKVGDIRALDKGTATQIYLDFVRPDTLKIKSILGMQAAIRQQVNIEKYSAEGLSSISKINLQSSYSNYICSIQRKKMKQPMPWESLSEFYVMEATYMSQAEYNEIKNTLDDAFYLSEKSNYQTDYWKNIATFHIPALSAGLEKELGKSLKLF